jgi:hypothetical protein
MYVQYVYTSACIARRPPSRNVYSWRVLQLLLSGVATFSSDVSLSNPTHKKYLKLIGTGKKIEVANTGRMDALADAERAAASQIVMSRAVLQNPLNPKCSALKSHVVNLDRFATHINPSNTTSTWRLLPTDFEEIGGITKVAGTQSLGFNIKHDMVISADGEVVSLLSIMEDSSLPDGAILKLEVIFHLFFFPGFFFFFVALWLCSSIILISRPWVYIYTPNVMIIFVFTTCWMIHISSSCIVLFLSLLAVFCI